MPRRSSAVTGANAARCLTADAGDRILSENRSNPSLSGTTHTWYVTFEVSRRGLVKKRRHPRLTKTFESEAEAKQFAREKLNDGVIVFAGTINPYQPKQLVPSSGISMWCGNPDQSADGPVGAPEHDEN